MLRVGWVGERQILPDLLYPLEGAERRGEDVLADISRATGIAVAALLRGDDDVPQIADDQFEFGFARAAHRLALRRRGIGLFRRRRREPRHIGSLSFVNHRFSCRIHHSPIMNESASAIGLRFSGAGT